MRATLTSKGQITVPKEIRDRLGLQQGDQIEFVSANGITVIRKFVAEGENPFLKQVGIMASHPGGSAQWQRELRGWDEWDRENLA